MQVLNVMIRPVNVEQYAERRKGVRAAEVSLGFRTVRLLAADELAGAQQGYGGGGWEPTWLVIASEDELGDPIVADLGDERLPVFTAAHGQGAWDPVQIADSFEGFMAGLEAVMSVSAGREHPVGLEANPLSDAEREGVLMRVRAANPGSDYDFWESWLEA